MSERSLTDSHGQIGMLLTLSAVRSRRHGYHSQAHSAGSIPVTSSTFEKRRNTQQSGAISLAEFAVVKSPHIRQRYSPRVSAALVSTVRDQAIQFAVTSRYVVSARVAAPSGVVLLVDMAVDAAGRRDGAEGLVQRTESLGLGLRLAGRDESADTDTDGHSDHDEHPEDHRGHGGRSATQTTNEVHPQTPLPVFGEAVLSGHPLRD